MYGSVPPAAQRDSTCRPFAHDDQGKSLMINRRTFFTAAAAGLAAAPAFAQFTGPSAQGEGTTAAAIENTRVGRYVTLEGNLVAHLRADYYSFSDDSGTVRVEIPRATFGGRQIGPADRVRIMGEVDTGRFGRYVWVKSLDVP
jgi:uncharacterized protein (TIGR00156 family)